MDGRVVGVLGGGQLARMMGEAAHRLGIQMMVLDPEGVDSPAGQITGSAIKGSFRDEALIRELSEKSDVLTMDIEHVNTEILHHLEEEGVQIHPSPHTVQLIQDKLVQKKYLRSKDVAVADFMEVESVDEAREAGNRFGYPFVLKSRLMAYDGRGNRLVESEDEISKAWEELGGSRLYVEKFADFTKELAVMVVRGADGIRSYPVVESVQENHVCAIVIAPADIPPSSYLHAKAISEKAISVLDGRGIYGVELFLLKNGEVLVNEIAPRPHNTGHYTIEACETDQFENHIRAILGLPLGSCDLKVGAALMYNILGDPTANPEVTYKPMHAAMNVDGASIHWYGKKQLRAGRKMAHLTVTGSSRSELAVRCQNLGIPYTLTVRKTAQVGIIMGSDSDLPTMKDAAEVLDKFQVPYELTVVSAHRTPKRMFDYAQNAAARGIRVIIAGAGGAAHLPGMVAALTPLPVIGVPVKTSTLNGQDSLLSIVQMPRGVPVATVAIGNATNAGLLAVRMLGMSSKSLEQKMVNFMEGQEEEVLHKADRLENIGYQEYLKH